MIPPLILHRICAECRAEVARTTNNHGSFDSELAMRERQNFLRRVQAKFHQRLIAMGVSVEDL